MGCDLPAEPQMEFVRKALGFLEDGQAVCPSFFVYWGCAKETKIFCNSVKRQKTQRIAVIVVLCYNEQRGRMNCA